MKKITLLLIAALFSTLPMAAKAKKTLYLAGDGTMAEYADSTACGWGQKIGEYLAPHVEIVNVAQLGQSAKTFIDEKIVEQLEKLRSRSMVLIQFGVNDLKEYDASKFSSLEAFGRRLNEIISVGHQYRINIILCTPLAQPYYKDGKLIDRFGGYAEEIRRVATYNHVALLDLEQATRTWLESITEEEAAAFYVTLDKTQLVNGEFQLNQAGAEHVASMVKDAMVNVNSKKLKKLLKK